MTTLYSFRLYVAGQTLRSRAALSNLQALCESQLQGSYALEVVDAVERPELAERERIIATPTVIRLTPLPELRVVGDLSDHERAADHLGLPDPEDGSSERGSR